MKRGKVDGLVNRKLSGLRRALQLVTPYSVLRGALMVYIIHIRILRRTSGFFWHIVDDELHVCCGLH